MERINIADKFAGIDEYWSPKIVGELNGQHVKLARLRGEFVWHHHEAEDEMFLVMRGELELQFRDRTVILREHEFCIVPRGVEHRPVARSEVDVLLFEPSTTLNTGNVRDDDRTVDFPERI